MIKELVARFVRDQLLPLENAALAREAATSGCVYLLSKERVGLGVLYRGLGLWGLDAPKSHGGADLPAAAMQILK